MNIAIIPARGGSKRIPKESILKTSKNLLSFGKSKMDIMVKKLIQ